MSLGSIFPLDVTAKSFTVLDAASVMVIGPPKSGKTSLLLRAALSYKSDWLVKKEVIEESDNASDTNAVPQEYDSLRPVILISSQLIRKAPLRIHTMQILPENDDELTDVQSLRRLLSYTLHGNAMDLIKFITEITSKCDPRLILVDDLDQFVTYQDELVNLALFEQLCAQLADTLGTLNETRTKGSPTRLIASIVDNSLDSTIAKMDVHVDHMCSVARRYFDDSWNLTERSFELEEAHPHFETPILKAVRLVCETSPMVIDYYMTNVAIFAEVVLEKRCETLRLSSTPVATDSEESNDSEDDLFLKQESQSD